MTMREQLTERVGKPHLSYSSLKYALGDMRLWEMYMRGQLKKEVRGLCTSARCMTCSFSNQKNSKMSTTLSMILAFVMSIGGASPRSTKRYKEWKAEAATDDAERRQESWQAKRMSRRHMK